ncbi:MAG: hypothetical protein AAGF13_07275 [Pseudomonadota bacterium]
MSIFGKCFVASLFCALASASAGNAFIYEEEAGGSCTFCPTILAAVTHDPGEAAIYAASTRVARDIAKTILVEPVETPTWRREGQRVFAEYELPKRIAYQGLHIHVSKDVLIWWDSQTGQRASIPAGTYPISDDGHLRIDLKRHWAK